MIGRLTDKRRLSRPSNNDYGLLNEMLLASGRGPIPSEVLVDPSVLELRPYLEDCLSFERFDLHEKNEHELRDMVIDDQFFARTVTMNYRLILFDIVAINRPNRRHHQRRR